MRPHARVLVGHLLSSCCREVAAKVSSGPVNSSPLSLSSPCARACSSAPHVTPTCAPRASCATAPTALRRCSSRTSATQTTRARPCASPRRATRSAQRAPAHVPSAAHRCRGFGCGLCARARPELCVCARRAVQAAREAVRGLVMPNGTPLVVRIGLACGPATSGIVGTKMPRFCLFGVSDRAGSSGREGWSQRAGPPVWCGVRALHTVWMLILDMRAGHGQHRVPHGVHVPTRSHPRDPPRAGHGGGRAVGAHGRRARERRVAMGALLESVAAAAWQASHVFGFALVSLRRQGRYGDLRAAATGWQHRWWQELGPAAA
jgi:hypothetical protein